MPKTFHDLHAQLIREASSNEEGESDATMLEGIIVDVINRGTTEISDSKVADGTVAGAIAVGKEVIYRLRAKDWKCNSASRAQRGTISKNWQIAYGDADANTTPKTDILVDGKQVSVKKGPGQLMSGTVAETKATFWAALGDTALKGDGDILTHKTTVAIDKCLAKMQEVLPAQWKDTKSGKVVVNPRAGQSIAKFKGKGTVAQLQAKPDKDLVFNYIDELQAQLTELFDEAFERNPELKVAFVKEAMTGEHKFVPGSPAIAKYLLSTSKTGTEAVAHTITYQYIKALAPKCEVAFSFKTGSIKNKTAVLGARNYVSVLRVNANTSQTALPIVKGLLSKQKQSKDVYNKLKKLQDKLNKTPLEIEKITWCNKQLQFKARDAKNLIYPQNPEDRLDPLTIKKVIELLGKTSPRLAKWVESGGAGNLPENFASTNLNTLTESMVELYEQELITEQELVEGMIDWLGAISNTLTNNATVAMAFGLRRTENMGSNLKNIADKFGIEVNVVVGKNDIDWHSISKGFAQQ